MMHSDKAQSLLTDYVEGTLSKGVKKEIDAVLEKDQESKKLFEGALKTRSQISNFPIVKASDDFDVKLRERINNINSGNEQSKQTSRRNWFIALSGSVVALALYVFIFTDIGYQQNMNNEVLPTPVANTEVENKLIQPAVLEENVVVDSLQNNAPEEVDNANIHLAGEE